MAFTHVERESIAHNKERVYLIPVYVPFPKGPKFCSNMSLGARELLMVCLHTSLAN